MEKKEAEKKKAQKRKEKEQRKEERKANNAKTGTSLEDMMAYVDENGNITSTPPDPTKKKVIKEEDILLGARKHEEPNPADAIRKGRVFRLPRALSWRQEPVRHLREQGHSQKQELPE